jgi:hypothetical protein
VLGCQLNFNATIGVVVGGALTYMSIRDEIGFRVKEGRLASLPPLLPGAVAERFIFVSDELNQLIGNAVIFSAETSSRMVRLRADLDHFTCGGNITVSFSPYSKPKSTYISLVDPDDAGIWDIRSRDPKPGMRVLGGFAEPDVFVALCAATRDELGGPGSREWRNFIETAKTKWVQLFNTYPTVKGDKLESYISKKAIQIA